MRTSGNEELPLAKRRSAQVDEIGLFLVRVWQREGGFHAAVRGVGEEEPLHFDDATRLTEFLARASLAAPPIGPSGHGGHRVGSSAAQSRHGGPDAARESEGSER